MKTRLNTFDIVCSVTELQKWIGMRVANVYDIDNRTYLIKLQRSEEKCVLLLESGNRIHTTAYDWPKNMAPSGFSMKLRKHLRNKRLESLQQLGLDRIVELQFGSGEAAYHVILELYDRGNIILTDYQRVILNILRPHTEGDAVKFMVREKYPQDRAKTKNPPPTLIELKELLLDFKQNENIKKILTIKLEYGPALTEHVMLEAGFQTNCKIGKGFNIEEDLVRLQQALVKADEIINEAQKKISKGYIIQKKEKRVSTNLNDDEYIYTNQEFHPMIFEQHKNQPFKEFESFDGAMDEFFSTLESQKIDMKALHQEREALKKLENVRKDHNQRLTVLEKTQEEDKLRAELISRNQTLVDNAILAVQSALASQVSWPKIEALVKAAQENGDPIAAVIKKLKLESNHITLLLTDPYGDSEESDEESSALQPMMIDIDLALTAFGNATKYYDQKRNAAKKQQKTIESQGKALKSAEKKTKQTLKEVQTITNINKARKVYWFEKFFWFISSENYLVIGGRDQQQNELIVKRYMRQNDIYVHADIHGASSVVIKNPTGETVPPKTLNEAGVMAICYSVAWEAKVVTSAWWVNAAQVSKTAPTGEYLTTGSFMVRGKKNYLPPCHLIMGFSFLFKLEDSSIERHKDERRIRSLEDEVSEVYIDETQKNENDEVDINLDSDNGEDSNDKDEVNAEDNQFPDTQIKIEHSIGTNINIKTQTNRIINNENTDKEETVIYLGDDKPVLLQNSGRPRTVSENKKAKTIEKEENIGNKINSNQIKRGQKSKLKKVKEKYKDQDEEERQLRMEILQSAGSAKENKKNKKGKDTKSKSSSNTNKIKKEPVVKSTVEKDTLGDNEVDVEEEKDVTANADVDMLDSLTGNPLPEDELLFAVPVVAPYNTLTNYKYKVKITPGTGKRGKASKTALAMFLKDKLSTPREKDLLKSVRDENMARNLPGKVKLSAPKLQQLKK